MAVASEDAAGAAMEERTIGVPFKVEMSLEFPKLNSPVIIAMKGLPCTAKSELGMEISQWAKSPLLYIDHFLDAVSLERGYTAESPPSPEEADRLHRLAFDLLCNAAFDNLRWGVDNVYAQSYNGVVIKSRLSSTFELDRLVKLARESGCGILLIVEFQMKNEYRFRLRLERKVKSGGQNKWYKPRSWKDIEKAMEDAHQPCFNWDLPLRRLLDDAGGLPRVARLVFDPFDDLYLGPPAFLTNASQDIMKYLLCSLEVGQDSNKQDLLMFEGPYVAVHYAELRRSLDEERIRAASAFSTSGRKYHLCGTKDDGCVLKYWEDLPDDKGKAYYCGVCEERVISGHPAYSCIDCFLLMHKSCAELPPDHHIEGRFEDTEFLRDYPNNVAVRKLACSSCKEGRKGFSARCCACLSQTHLKCRVLPPVINHDCHNHFLKLTFTNAHRCNACGTTQRAIGAFYNCYTCTMSYDIECVSQLRQVKHEHGGHKHVLKLTYSHDGMEKEEAYWCDICYEDMDPQNWFYSCQNCPYYAAHPQCARLSGSRRITASSSQSS